MTIENLNSRFVYLADKFDSWRIMNNPKGPLRGDCDDYAITALYIMAGSHWKMWCWLLTFQAVIWATKTIQGDLHAVLWLRGCGYIDNIHPFWRRNCIHKKLVPMIFPLVALKMFVGSIQRLVDRFLG